MTERVVENELPTVCAGMSHVRPLESCQQRAESRTRSGKCSTHGNLLLNHVPPTPALFSYIVSSTFGIFCGNLVCQGMSSWGADYDRQAVPYLMPARMPLNPAPMTMTLMGLYSSMEKSPRVNLPSGWTSSPFALGGMRERPPPGIVETTGK